MVVVKVMFSNFMVVIIMVVQKCFAPESIHPQKKVPYALLYQQKMEHAEKLKEIYKPYRYHEIWECEWKQQYTQTQYDEDLSNNILDREELFYGGRTEVFSPYANDTEENSIQYHDVCSLYPTVCTHDVLPTGFPTRYFGLNARAQLIRLHPTHPDAIFGYVRCHVRPNIHDRIGLLPEHKNNKLVFDLTEKKGTWFTEELYLAMSQGYQICDVYEILHFDQHNRSCNYMKGYMSFF
jgi:DNA polymerase type B, organellar and viral